VCDVHDRNFSRTIQIAASQLSVASYFCNYYMDVNTSRVSCILSFTRSFVLDTLTVLKFDSLWARHCPMTVPIFHVWLETLFKRRELAAYHQWKAMPEKFLQPRRCQQIAAPTGTHGFTGRSHLGICLPLFLSLVWECTQPSEIDLRCCAVRIS
jgi:hypothetical protein